MTLGVGEEREVERRPEQLRRFLGLKRTKHWFTAPDEGLISVAHNDAGSTMKIAGSVADNSGLNVFQLQIIPVGKWR